MFVLDSNHDSYYTVVCFVPKYCDMTDILNLTIAHSYCHTNLVAIATVYMQVFEGLAEGKDFRGLNFADHQVEYIVSLSHCFFLRIKILRSTSLYSAICVPMYTVLY